MRTLAAVLMAIVAGGQSYPPAFPRQNATKLFETDRIVVWDIVWPNGQPTPMHRHLHDQVGTYYQSGGRAITSEDGTRRESSTPVGNISNTRKGTTHIEEGITDPPLRAVFIELLTDVSASTDASGRTGLPGTMGEDPAFPREGAAKLLDDERVVIWDYTWSRDSSTSVGFARKTVTVWLGSGKLRLTADGKASMVNVAPGQIRYNEAGSIERIDVLEGSPRAMVFEFK